MRPASRHRMPTADCRLSGRPCRCRSTRRRAPARPTTTYRSGRRDRRRSGRRCRAACRRLRRYPGARWRIDIAENERQAILVGAEDDDFRIGRLRQRQRRLDAAPAQIRVRNALADGALKGGDAVGLDLLALGFLRFALDAEFVFLNLVVLLGLAIDGGDDGRRQFDAEHQRIEELDRALQEVVVVLGVGLLHGLGLHQFVETGAERLLPGIVNLVLDRLARGVNLLGGVLRNDLTGLAADLGTDHGGEIVRADELVQHGDRIVLQLISYTHLNGHAHAVLGNGVVCLRRRLQPQIVKIQLVPRHDQVQALLPDIPGIEHRAANKAHAVRVETDEPIPQDADLPGRNRNHDIRPQHDRDQQQRHQNDGEPRQVTPDAAPATLRRQRLAIEDTPNTLPSAVIHRARPSAHIHRTLLDDAALVHAHPARPQCQLVKIAVIVGDDHDGGAGGHQIRQ